MAGDGDMAFGSIFKNLFGSSEKQLPATAATGHSRGLDERMGRRRELVNQAVAEVMMDAGVVSSAYRHETRTVDARGHHFLVDIDLPKALAAVTAGNLARIGATITRKAQAKNGVDVVGVYWRVDGDSATEDHDIVNLLTPGSPREVPPTPTVAPASPAPTNVETASQKIARLRESLKDDGHGAGAGSSAASGSDAVDDGADAGFANTVIGFDVDEPPSRKR